MGHDGRYGVAAKCDSSVKAAFHDTDIDTDTDMLARMSVSVSVISIDVGVVERGLYATPLVRYNVLECNANKLCL